MSVANRFNLKKIKHLKKTILSLSEKWLNKDTLISCIELSKNYLPNSLFLIFKSYLNLKNKAINIYFLGPRVYKLLLNILSLPSIITLKHVTSTFELIPGQILFNIISIKINHFNDESKECVLYVDQMVLKTSIRYNINKDKIVALVRLILINL